MATLEVSGYGVPYNSDILYQENAQIRHIRQLKQQTVNWLKQQHPDSWAEFQAIEKNIEQLDILAARRLN